MLFVVKLTCTDSLGQSFVDLETVLNVYRLFRAVFVGLEPTVIGRYCSLLNVYRLFRAVFVGFEPTFIGRCCSLLNVYRLSRVVFVDLEPTVNGGCFLLLNVYRLFRALFRAVWILSRRLLVGVVRC